jgi:hypothetical protein
MFDSTPIIAAGGCLCVFVVGQLQVAGEQDMEDEKVRSE